MSKPQHIKGIKALLLFLTVGLGFQIESQAQTIYGATGFPDALWTVNPVGCYCDVSMIGLLKKANGTPVYPEGDIALSPEGIMYLSAFGELFTVDPTTAICTPVPGMPVIPYFLNGLVCAGNGILYGIEENSGKKLFKFDVNNNTATLIGLVPYENGGGMFIYNSSVYMVAYEGLALVDTINPMNTMLVFSFPPGFYVEGVTVYGDCNMAIMNAYDGDYGFWLLSLIDGSLIKICNNGFVFMFMTSMNEFFPTSCTLLLDLDCNDSSGATEADFNSPTFSCLTPDGVPIADEDDIIISNKKIIEMTISLSPAFEPDGSNEFLDVGGPISSSINVIGAGTDNITLINSGGSARIQDFIEALREINYLNTLEIPTEGQRTVEVQYTVDSGESCEIATAYIDVIDLPFIQVDLGPDVTPCEGELTTFDAGNPGATYLWSTNDITQTITTDIEDEYIVTVSNGVDCPNMDTVLLDVLPNIDVSLGPDTYICDNASATISITSNSTFPITVELDISPGSPITISNITGNYSFTDQPTGLTTYTITDVIPSEPACITISDPDQIIDVYPTYFTLVDTSICDGDSVWLGTYWQTNGGVYGSTYSSQLGCDSVVNTTIHILPQVMLFHDIDTCVASATGVFVTYLANPNGCDTIVQTTIHLTPSDTTLLTTSTCIASQSGIQTMITQGTNGCDSVIITTTIYSPPTDTTQVLITTCDPFAAGIFMDTILSLAGCDSLIQRHVLYSPPDTSYTYSESCLPADTGIFLTTLINIIGCDSLIIHSISLTTPDTTYANLTSCDSADLGTHEQLFVTSLGCDSLQITTVTFSAQDSTFLFSTSCFSTDTGITVQEFTNQFGCDSVVTQHVTLAPSQFITLQSISCNPADTGAFVTHLINQYGCDSTIATIISLAPSQDLVFNTSTCHLADTGTFVQHYLNQFGCDSVVTEIKSFSSAHDTEIHLTSCDSAQAGTIETMLTASDGCDSLVTVITTFTPAPQINLMPLVDFNGFGISCNGGSDGSIISNVVGSAPLHYLWNTGSTDASVSGLPAGLYDLTVTNINGCFTTGEILLNEPPALQSTYALKSPDCFDVMGGSINIFPQGGVPPYHFSINGSSYQANSSFTGLEGGSYDVVTLDANQCQVNSMIALDTPLQVQVDLGADITIIPGTPVQLLAMINIPIDSLAFVNWTGIDHTSCPQCLLQTLTPIATTTYTIEVADWNGCSSTDSVTVFVADDTEVFVPNVFSPNDDQVNDRLLLNGGKDVGEIQSFTVFDRWGNLVFEANNFQPGDPRFAWDGTFNGKPVNPGVFVYQMLMVDQHGKSVVKYGNVTVVR